MFLFIFVPPPSAKEGFLFSEPNRSVNLFKKPSEEKQTLFLEEKSSVLPEFSQPIVIGENSFRETAPVMILETKTLGALAFRANERREIEEYIVRPGDTLSLIANKFDISLETILWANDLNRNSRISPGQKLTILPVSGIMHLVKKGETVSAIAKKYQDDVSEIINFNQLSERGEVFVGDLLIVPDGKLPSKPLAYSTPMASSYFICPLPAPCTITQGLHWYNAVDFSNGKCGEPVFAAAGGKIQKTGYHSIAGKYIRILHPNGTVSFYGHLSVILTKVGQKVSQGEIIGYTGNTGYTLGPTGCHLHFEVRGAKNPFAI